MRTLLAGLFALLASGCVQEPMTYQKWKAEQARKARIEQVRREAKEMGKTPVVFTKEEQERAGAEQKNADGSQK